MGAVSKSPFQADSDVPSQIPSFEGQRVIFLLDFIVPTLLCQHQGVVHRTWKEHRIHIDLMRPNESVQSPDHPPICQDWFAMFCPPLQQTILVNLFGVP